MTRLTLTFRRACTLSAITQRHGYEDDFKNAGVVSKPENLDGNELSSKQLYISNLNDFMLYYVTVEDYLIIAWGADGSVRNPTKSAFIHVAPIYGK